LVNIYFSNVDITIKDLFLNRGLSSLEIYLSYNKFPAIPELDVFFEQALNLLTVLEQCSFGLKLYVHTYSIIGAESFFRYFNLPTYLGK